MNRIVILLSVVVTLILAANAVAVESYEDWAAEERLRNALEKMAEDERRTREGYADRFYGRKREKTPYENYSIDEMLELRETALANLQEAKNRLQQQDLKSWQKELAESSVNRYEKKINSYDEAISRKRYQLKRQQENDLLWWRAKQLFWGLVAVFVVYKLLKEFWPRKKKKEANSEEAPFDRKLRQGKTLYKNKKYGEALEAFTQLLKEAPHNRSVLYCRALAYKQMFRSDLREAARLGHPKAKRIVKGAKK